jgi:hypothetical protein
VLLVHLVLLELAELRVAAELRELSEHQELREKQLNILEAVAHQLLYH